MAISGPSREGPTWSDGPLAADKSRVEVSPCSGAQRTPEAPFVVLGFLVFLAAITTYAQPTTDPNQFGYGSQHVLPHEWRPTQASANVAAPNAPRSCLEAHFEIHHGAQVNDSTSLFIGWKGETPVLRQEYVMDDGTLKTLFYTIKRNGTLSQLHPSVSQPAGKHARPKDPQGLAPGRVLALENPEQTSKAEVRLEVQADAQKLEELHQAIQEWQDGKRDADKGFPQVAAMLRIHLTLPNEKPVLVWEHSTTLSASGGEAGFSYSAPHLSLAVLSPTGKTLLVQLTTGEAVEYQIITIPEMYASVPQTKAGSSPGSKNPGGVRIIVYGGIIF